MKKTTQELLNELKKSSSVSAYLSENQDSLYDFVLKDYLSELLLAKGIPKAEVISKSGLHQIYAYQIFSGRKNPSRDKLIAICFGMRLTLAETQQLLKLAGITALYPRSKRDSAILFALENRLSIMECNDLLYALEEYTL